MPSWRSPSHRLDQWFADCCVTDKHCVSLTDNGGRNINMVKTRCWYEIRWKSETIKKLKSAICLTELSNPFGCTTTACALHMLLDHHRQMCQQMRVNTGVGTMCTVYRWVFVIQLEEKLSIWFSLFRIKIAVFYKVFIWTGLFNSSDNSLSFLLLYARVTTYCPVCNM